MEEMGKEVGRFNVVSFYLTVGSKNWSYTISSCCPTPTANFEADPVHCDCAKAADGKVRDLELIDRWMDGWMDGWI